jgi:hypothetical protein
MKRAKADIWIERQNAGGIKWYAIYEGKPTGPLAIQLIDPEVFRAIFGLYLRPGEAIPVTITIKRRPVKARATR